MNYRTRSILTSTLTCLCIAGIALASFFYFKERNTPIDENEENNKTEENKNVREAREQRMREHRQRERARNNRVIKVIERNDDQDWHNPQHIRDDFRKGLEEYRALPPEERARWDEEMSRLSNRILNDGVPQVIDGIRNATPDELADMREQFSQVTEFLDTTINEANLASMLTPEEDQSIGQFLRDINMAHDEVQRALYTN